MPSDDSGDGGGYDDDMDSEGGDFQVVSGKRKERNKSGSEGESRPVKERRVNEFKVILKLSGSGTRGMNFVKLAEHLGKEIGTFLYAKALANGRILVVCKSKVQQEKALALKSLNRCDVEVYVPGTGTRAKGVIYGVPTDITVDEILEKVKGGRVMEAKRFLVTRDNEKVESQTVLLTFSSEVSPQRVELGYLSFQVKPYIRPPLRCFNCQRFGHVAAVCRGRRKCGKCGGDHNYGDCESESSLCCPNCGEEHSAAYKGCRHYVKALEIQKVRSNERVSYAEALKRVNNEQGAGNPYPRQLPLAPRVQIVHSPPSDSFIFKKVDFLAFITDVVSGSKVSKNRSDVIKLVSNAADKYLKMTISPESLFQFLKNSEGRLTVSQGSEGGGEG